MKTAGLRGVLCFTVALALSGEAARAAEVPSQPDAAAADFVSTNGNTGYSGTTLPQDVKPNGAFAELIRLVQAGVEESVILTYIRNTPRLFELDADDIILLTDLGTPAEVITAAIEHDQLLIEEGISPAAAPVESEPAAAGEDLAEKPAEVTTEVFYDTLAPYGAWVDIDGYGRCWRPFVIVYNTTWHPYCDNGRWVYTDCGWYWRSGYTWGWATFHYGRWFRHSRYGWCWWPDTVWAPSWVCWRYDRSYCGWAPLPPYTYYRSGIGVEYRGSRVTAGFDFGLDADAYTFVAVGDFADPKPRSRRVDKGEASRIYRRTTAFQKINYDREQGRIRNAGIPHRDIARASRQEIRPVSIAQARGIHGRQHEPGGRINRPNPVSSGRTAPAATRTESQRSYRAENPGRSVTQGGSAQGSQRGRSYQSPPPRQEPPLRAAPRQPERDKAAAPQTSGSYRSSQRPA